jgi:uncharacterized protein
VQALLDMGANPNYEALDAMEILLARGADPALKTRIDEYATPLDEAELTGNAEGAAMLKRLLDR